MNQNFGIMDSGYFKSKNQLLQWINENLKLNLQKIEDLGQGSIFCQILDASFPGQVPLNKVNWNAKTEYEYICNFKLLTASMNKFGIVRYVDIHQQVKCKLQDNLELCQWLVRFYELNTPENADTYDAVQRRGYKPTPFDIKSPDEYMFSSEFKNLDDIKNSKAKVDISSQRKTLGYQNKSASKPLASALKNNNKKPVLQEISNSNNMYEEKVIQTVDILNGDMDREEQIAKLRKLYELKSVKKSAVPSTNNNQSLQSSQKQVNFFQKQEQQQQETFDKENQNTNNLVQVQQLLSEKKQVSEQKPVLAENTLIQEVAQQQVEQQ